ncbi:MAG: DEAD/DEAH box helicase [Candidatus Sericytochromatia bacterium]
MSKRINPLTTSDELRETYLNYLTSSFSLRNPELAHQFKQRVQETQDLFKGPILQASPHYRTGKSLAELAATPDFGVTPEFLNYAPGLSAAKLEKALPLDRPLYLHQQNALYQLAQNKNVVVATGTGSGKTESFLFPIINHLLKERANNGGILSPGVRAMLIYPMNALANDQIKRLRELLPPETGITFGRYTGQTEEIRKSALESFEAEVGHKPQKNELISREEIRQAPPHLLLTNYAMLEYLLIRPEDAEIFKQGHTWSFIVLDEAHTYKGALGTEIGYLMRKLKDRVSSDDPNRIRCIATSATIGNENSEEVHKQVIDAVKVLFGAPFAPESLIFADKIKSGERLSYTPWGEGTFDFYQLLAQLQEEVEALSGSQILEKIEYLLLSTLADRSDEQGFPESTVLEETLNHLETGADPAVCLSTVIFELLKGDQRVHELILSLEVEPIPFETLSERFFPTYSIEDAQKALVWLIDLATLAKDPHTNVPLLLARYHFFIKSMEGLSITFPEANRPQIMIGRFSESSGPAGTIPAFELRGCKRCGATYLHGNLQYKNSYQHFVSYPEKKKLTDINEESVYFAIDLEDNIEASEDELALAECEASEILDGPLLGPVEQRGTKVGDPCSLCVHCGRYSENEMTACCNSPMFRQVREIMPTDQRARVIKTCPACGGQQKSESIITTFRTNENTAALVLGRSLFGNIPPSREIQDEQEQEEVEDNFFNPFALAKPSKSVSKDTGKRRLLAFSDSRMDAAYFASFMQQQSARILHRQLIYRTLISLSKKGTSFNCVNANDLIEPLIEQATEIQLLKGSILERHQEVCKWLYAELCAIQPRQNLEGVGLIHWRLNPDIVAIIRGLFQSEHVVNSFQSFGLDFPSFIGLLENWLAYLRKRSVVAVLNDQAGFSDGYFWPRNRPYSIRENTSDTRWSVAAWNPGNNRQNGREELLQKYWIKIGFQLDNPAKCKQLLKIIWDLISKHLEPNEKPALANKKLSKIWPDSNAPGEAFQLNPELWTASLQPYCEEDLKGVYGWFRCETCGNLSGINLHGICPTYRCKGKLQSENEEALAQGNYYRQMYLSHKLLPIEIAEHTAQITTEEGAKRQQNFINDNHPLNILSCSTTFELGVDVGQLHAVFMRNVPPSIANYVQRAGRAARRIDSTAFILTFCKARSHDLAHFAKADELVSGEVQPPRIPVKNLDIARRHLHSIVLSQFFKTYPEYFNGPENKRTGQVYWFFFNQAGSDACASVHEWLTSRPEGLQQSLERIFGDELIMELGIDTWQWENGLVSPMSEFKEGEKPEDLRLCWDGILGRAQAELVSEYLNYQRIINDPEIGKNWPNTVKASQRQCNRIQSKRILDYLPTRGVLPKYGFPVDVVPLKLQSVQDWATQINLDRDLRMAISEFAPGSTLVANGKIIRCYGIQKAPRKEWKEFHFHVCANCGRFQHGGYKGEKVPKDCSCGNYTSYKNGQCIIPEFGFTTAIHEEGIEPVDTPPRRTYSSQIFFSSYDRNDEPEPSSIGKPSPQAQLRLETAYSKHGKLVVINDNNGSMFHICRACGYGSRKTEMGIHKTPWGIECVNKVGTRPNGTPGSPLRPLVLGHEFKTDVVELRFSGPGLDLHSGQDLWLSVLAALVRGACQALQIEEDNLDGTLGNYSGGPYRSLVIFDTFPGGAGFVRELQQPNALKRVIEAALEIAESCPACSESQSCNACLRRYQNQFAHDLLKRGLAAAFLRELRDSLFSEADDGFFPPSNSHAGQWLEQQIKQARSCQLVISNLPAAKSEIQKWYGILSSAASSGCKIQLLIADPQQNLMHPNQLEHVAGLIWLSQGAGISIYTYGSNIQFPIQLVIDVGPHLTLARWNEDAPIMNPRDRSLRINILSGHEHSDLNRFNHILKSVRAWSRSELEDLFRKTFFIRLNRQQKTTWAQLLGDRLQPDLKQVEIYDRYIRRQNAFESLWLFLEMLQAHAKTNNINKIEVSLYTSYGTNKNDEGIPNSSANKYLKIEKDYQEKIMFPDLRKAEEKGGNFDRLKFVNLKTQHKQDTKVHQRYVHLISAQRAWNLKLEKGFDILQYNDHWKQFFVTEDSFLVLVDESSIFNPDSKK